MDIPSIIHGVQDDYRRLYHSDPQAALKMDITLAAGYGLLKSGTVMALNKSASGNVDKYVPYNPTTFSNTVLSPGRAFLVADVGASANVVYVSKDDGYKFVVGDDLIINDNATSAENLGAITAIDRTSYPHMTKITVTTVTSGTFEVSAYGHILVEAGDNTNNYSDAVGILEQSRDTGTGANAKGALGTLILSNALLYEGCLILLDDAAKTDLAASSKGQFLCIK
jgi:hypothetical protein